MQIQADKASLQDWLRQHQDKYQSLKNFDFELISERPNKSINVCEDKFKILVLPNVSEIFYCYTRDQWIDKLWAEVRLSAFHYPIIILNILIFLFGTTGNIFVCLSVKRNHQLRSVTNYFIVNLAFADFLVILICLPATVVWDLSLTWLFDTLPCKLIMFLQDVSISVSVLTLTAISIDRYYAICHPLKFKSSLSQAKRVIALIWLVSLVTMAPDLIYLSAKRSPDLVEAGLDTVLYSDCNYDWSDSASRAFQFVKTILLYLIPFLLMFCAHYRILKVLRLAADLAQHQDYQHLHTDQLDEPTGGGGGDAAGLRQLSSSSWSAAGAAAAAAGASRPGSLTGNHHKRAAPAGSSSDPSESKWNVRRMTNKHRQRHHEQLLINSSAQPLDDGQVEPSFGEPPPPPPSADLPLERLDGKTAASSAAAAAPSGSFGTAQVAPMAPDAKLDERQVRFKQYCDESQKQQADLELGGGPPDPCKRPRRGGGGGGLLLLLLAAVNFDWKVKLWRRSDEKKVGDNIELDVNNSRQAANSDNNTQMSTGSTMLSEHDAYCKQSRLAANCAPNHQAQPSPVAVGDGQNNQQQQQFRGTGQQNDKTSRNHRPACSKPSNQIAPTSELISPAPSQRRRSTSMSQHDASLVLTMHNKSKLESRRKAAQMLTAIVVLFGICYLPVHLINFLRQFIDDIPQTDVTSTICMLAHCICYLNSAINPIIYNHMNSVFRAEFRKFLRCLDCCWRTNKSPSKQQQQQQKILAHEHCPSNNHTSQFHHQGSRRGAYNQTNNHHHRHSILNDNYQMSTATTTIVIGLANADQQQQQQQPTALDRLLDDEENIARPTRAVRATGAAAAADGPN